MLTIFIIVILKGFVIFLSYSLIKREILNTVDSAFERIKNKKNIQSKGCYTNSR